MQSIRIEQALALQQETRMVDFKREFDPSSDGQWCELLKDFAAMANSGGGVIIVGLSDDGIPSGADVQPVLALNPAKITDKLFKYTGEHHAGFQICEASRNNHKLAVVVIDVVSAPIVFAKPGTYSDPAAAGKQKTAFSAGTVYFRHGAKSEPATGQDLREFIGKQVDAVRETLLQKVRMVIEAPVDAAVAIDHTMSSDASGKPIRIQLTTDPNAPVYRKLDPDVSHPFRQKELIMEVNGRLPVGTAINSRDILCVRGVYEVDEKSAPQFCHLAKYGGAPQYSEAFVEWVVEQYRSDSEFFTNARARYKEPRFV